MNSDDAPTEKYWQALREHGRAGVGRPRKDAVRPTLGQLGLTKWMARRALALTAQPLTDAQMDDIADRVPGRSLTALLEARSRDRRRRNPLLRAWRVALVAERVEFLGVIQRMASNVERAEAVNAPDDTSADSALGD